MKKHSLLHGITIFIFTASCCIHSQTVSSISALQAAINLASPGDVIELADGNYTDNAVLNITTSGTSGNMITIKAKNPGEAIFSGTFGVKINASYIKFSGFDFNGGFVSADNGNRLITINQEGNIVEDIRMINITNGVAKHSYIYLYGGSKNTIIRRCWFESSGTTNEGIKVFGWVPEDSTGKFTTVEYCYFRSDEGTGNGVSAIRFGSGSAGWLTNINASNTVRNNLFYKYDGESEVISLKSAYNIIEKNTFLNSVGTVNSRKYHNNTFRDNYFLNTDPTLAEAGVVGLWGEDHLVEHNYFYKPKSRSNEIGGAINLIAGTGNAINILHEQVNNVTIKNNIIYEASLTSGAKTNHAIVSGVKFDAVTRNFLPQNVTIEGNCIYNSNATREQVHYISTTPTGFTYTDNKIWTVASVVPVAQNVNPNLIAVVENGYDVHTCGSKGPRNTTPLQPGNVGPLWLAGAILSSKKIEKIERIQISPNPFSSEISISNLNSKFKKIELTDMLGRFIDLQSVEGLDEINLSPTFKNKTSGIYILKLIGEKSTKSYKLIRK